MNQRKNNNFFIKTSPFEGPLGGFNIEFTNTTRKICKNISEQIFVLSKKYIDLHITLIRYNNVKNLIKYTKCR